MYAIETGKYSIGTIHKTNYRNKGCKYGFIKQSTLADLLKGVQQELIKKIILIFEGGIGDVGVAEDQHFVLMTRRSVLSGSCG